ncbi:hypothetical protein [Amycolatopsis lurida]|uniref:Uncharacterized protein n=1 Tax=Amycolatopsis lurida NRRL 2430 TaxID=1460371 RepID=A0A2P2FYR0_AMYLU|nr:hypothetical protein [Amycolatopsis lurida]KFU81835.1 hypothetical protein BB31_08270 [Amycolatopsis lurida NRRL 2430]
MYAAGIIILRTGGHTCFMTIDNLLAQWNAWLPVFSAVSTQSSATRPDAGLAADSTGPVGNPLQGLVELERLGG